MSSGSYNPTTQFVRDGEAVNARVTNRAVRTLEANVRYLRGLIESARLGQAVVRLNVPLAASTVVGGPVYLDAATATYKPAALTTTSSSGGTALADSARVAGVVTAKHSATLGDLLVYGYATGVDISPAVGGTPAAGPYYLSPTTAGRLTATRPAIPVPVLTFDGVGVSVAVGWVDPLGQHGHRKLDLVCRPAGTHVPPAEGEPHEITDPDAGLEGWLPADHESFGGLAPAGAVFGYNLAADPAAAAAWPPDPVDSAVAEFDAGAAGGGFAGTRDRLVLLDRNGIWWTSDCYGDVPWPTDLDTESPASASESGCPRARDVAMRVWTTYPRVGAVDAAVASLTSRSERLTIERCDGTAGSTGDLAVTLDLDYETVDGQAGYQALKGFDGDTFAVGPVCEGLYALSDEVTLTSPATSLLDPDDEDSPLVHHGPVGIDLSPAGSRELTAELFRLETGAEQAYYEDVPYLNFPSGRAARIVIRVNVPDRLTVPTPLLTLNLAFFGRSGGTLPTLTLLARRIPKATTTAAALPTATADASVSLPAIGALAANNYKLVASGTLAVAAGDLVLFKLSRGASDGYVNDVGLLKFSALVESGA